jgi:hypothetical protein
VDGNRHDFIARVALTLRWLNNGAWGGGRVLGPSPGQNTLPRRRHRGMLPCRVPCRRLHHLVERAGEKSPRLQRSITLHAPTPCRPRQARKSHIAVASLPDESNTPTRRQFAERRNGSDQRIAPRRTLLPSSSTDMRKRVDRRGGPERRSTLERRSHSARNAYMESPSEHLRNALQLLDQMTAVSDLDAESRADLSAALERLRRALGSLERRSGA